MFIFYVMDLSTKKNVKTWVHTFIKPKLQTVGHRKKNHEKILFFHMCVFSENAKCFVGAFL